VTVELRYPVNALTSFRYFKDVDLTPLTAGGLRLIADSGAFSAASQGTPIDLDEFADWATRVRHLVSWVASLDVIGDADRTWTNYQRLRSLHGLDVIPTVHYGADPSLLDRYAGDGVDFVGLGGMVGRKSEPQRLLRWTLHMFRYARDHHPGMRFHGWGVTHPQLLAALPWFSVDSSGAGSAYRYGRASLFNPDTAQLVTASMNGRDMHRHSDLLRRWYGVTPAEVSTSSSTNRSLHVRMAARSLQLREDWLRARHRVTPPTYGLTDAPSSGPHVHISDTTSINYVPIMRPADDGPHIHYVDAAPGHLARLTERTP